MKFKKILKKKKSDSKQHVTSSPNYLDTTNGMKVSSWDYLLADNVNDMLKENISNDNDLYAHLDSKPLSLLDVIKITETSSNEFDNDCNTTIKRNKTIDEQEVILITSKSKNNESSSHKKKFGKYGESSYGINNNDTLSTVLSDKSNGSEQMEKEINKKNNDGNTMTTSSWDYLSNSNKDNGDVVANNEKTTETKTNEAAATSTNPVVPAIGDILKDATEVVAKLFHYENNTFNNETTATATTTTTTTDSLKQYNEDAIICDDDDDDDSKKNIGIKYSFDDLVVIDETTSPLNTTNKNLQQREKELEEYDYGIKATPLKPGVEEEDLDEEIGQEIDIKESTNIIIAVSNAESTTQNKIVGKNNKKKIVSRFMSRLTTSSTPKNARKNASTVKNMPKVNSNMDMDESTMKKEIKKKINNDYMATTSWDYLANSSKEIDIQDTSDANNDVEIAKDEDGNIVISNNNDTSTTTVNTVESADTIDGNKIDNAEEKNDVDNKVISMIKGRTKKKEVIVERNNGDDYNKNGEEKGVVVESALSRNNLIATKFNVKVDENANFFTSSQSVSTRNTAMSESVSEEIEQVLSVTVNEYDRKINSINKATTTRTPTPNNNNSLKISNKSITDNTSNNDDEEQELIVEPGDRYFSLDSNNEGIDTLTDDDNNETTNTTIDDAGTCETDSIFLSLPDSDIASQFKNHQYDKKKQQKQPEMNDIDDDDDDDDEFLNDQENNMNENNTNSTSNTITSSIKANNEIYEKYSKDCKKKSIKTAFDALTSIENVNDDNSTASTDNNSGSNRNSSVKYSMHSYLHKTKSFTSKKRQHHKNDTKKTIMTTPMSNLPSVLEDIPTKHDNTNNNNMIQNLNEKINNKNVSKTNIGMDTRSHYSRHSTRSYALTNTMDMSSASQFYVQTSNSSVHMNRMVQSLNDVMISGNCTIKETARSNLRFISVPPGDIGIKLAKSKKLNQLIVKEIHKDSIVYGRMNVGDIILSVNKTDVSCLSAKAVMKLLLSNNGAMRTILYQPKSSSS